MKNSIIIICSIFIISHTFSSCKKDDNGGNSNVNEQLKLDSLVAENIIIAPGKATKIKAYAKGEGIAYSWNVALGDILGSGAEITYMAPPFALGDYVVTCKVTDKAKNSLSKSITISVK
jgi:hypothetical protein